MKKILFGIINILIIVNSLFSYRWPLDIAPQITSSFGEFRRTHFHSGIDLSTNQRNGLAVRTIEEGILYRIKIEKYNYGYSLYVKHKNNIISYYAHLEKFSEKINSFLKENGYNVYRDYFDFKPGTKTIYFNKNEVIAFSGDSGAGLSHLHFEILKNDDESLNPLSILSYKDDVYPVLKKIIIEPVNAESKINNCSDELELELEKSPFEFHKGEYVLQDQNSSLFIEGNIKIKLNCFDKDNFGYNTLGIYNIKLFLDNKNIFNLAFDNYNQSSDFFRHGIVFDIARSHLLPTYMVYNLYANPYTNINFLNQSNNIMNYLDTKKLNTGKHTLKIEVFDIANNKSYIEFQFYKVPSNEIDIMIPDKLYSSKVPFTVSAKENIKLKKADIYVSSDYIQGNFEKVASFLVNANSFYYEYDLSNYQYNKIMFMVNCEDEYNRATNSAVSPVIYVLKSNSIDYEKRDLKYILKDEKQKSFISLNLTTNNLLKSIPEISIFNKSNLIYKTMFKMVKPKEYILNLSLDKFNDGTYSSEIIITDYFDNQRKIHFNFIVNGILRKFGGTVSSQDNKLFLNIEQNVLFEDTVYFEIEQLAQTKFNLPDGLSFASEIYSIYPKDIFYDTEQTIQIRSNFTREDDLNKIGMYRYDKFRDVWYWMSKKREFNWIHGKTRYNEIFALVKDDVKPVIVAFHPFGIVKDAMEEVYVLIKEIGSGLNENDIHFKIDNKELIVKYDADYQKIYFVPEIPWKRGEHLVEVYVVDNANNQSTVKTFTFELK